MSVRLTDAQTQRHTSGQAHRPFTLNCCLRAAGPLGTATTARGHGKALLCSTHLVGAAVADRPSALVPRRGLTF